MKKWIKARIVQALRSRGVHVFRVLPRGVDLAYDLRRALPRQTFQVVFDVGANVGQSAVEFLDEFPQARIWCFEPSGELYGALAAQFAGSPRVIPQQLAFSSSVAEATLVHTSIPTMFHIAQGASGLPEGVTVTGSEAIQATTLDAYCDGQGIDRIDFLKIDTEGHDLEVLLGAKAMLEAGRIMCIQCECGLHPDNTFHCGLDKIKPFLEGFGYRLFGIYEQFEEGFGDTPNLRRANVVFVAPQVLEANRISKR